MRLYSEYDQRKLFEDIEFEFALSAHRVEPNEEHLDALHLLLDLESEQKFRELLFSILHKLPAFGAFSSLHYSFFLRS